MGIASEIWSRDIEAERELNGKQALCKLPDVRLITVVRESWEGDEVANRDEDNGEIDVTTYIRPSATDIVDVLKYVNLEAWEDIPSGARIYGAFTEYYGTTVRNYVAVPEPRAEQYTFTLTGWSPSHLRVIRKAISL